MSFTTVIKVLTINHRNTGRKYAGGRTDFDKFHLFPYANNSRCVRMQQSLHAKQDNLLSLQLRRQF